MFSEIENKVEKVENRLNERSLAYEIVAELKKTSNRLWLAIWILIGLLAATNFYWVYTFTQYDFVSYSQDGDGFNNVNVNNGGDVYNNNGTESEDQDAEKQ